MTAPLVIHELPHGFWHAEGGFLDYGTRSELAARPKLRRCECGTVTNCSPHAPHWKDGVKVDCRERKLR